MARMPFMPAKGTGKAQSCPACGGTMKGGKCSGCGKPAAQCSCGKGKR